MPSVTVNIAANIASLVTGMDRAERSINTFAKRAGRTFGNVAGAFGVVMGARQIASFVQGQAEAVDALAKTSDRLGVTTEQLTALQHAANLAGVDTNTLATALQYMQRIIGSAVAGEKAAVDAFKSIGLNAKALSTMGTHGSLLAVADAMGKVDNNATKLKATQEIFGRSGMGMVNVMENGSKAFKDAATETERLGTAISRVDAKKVEDMNDDFERSKTALQGLGQVILLELAEPLQWAANFATRTVVALNKRLGFGDGPSGIKKWQEELAAAKKKMDDFAVSAQSGAATLQFPFGKNASEKSVEYLKKAEAARAEYIAKYKAFVEYMKTLSEEERTKVFGSADMASMFASNEAFEQFKKTVAAGSKVIVEGLAPINDAIDEAAERMKYKFKDAFASILAEGKGFTAGLQQLFTSLKYDFLKEAFGMNKAKNKSDAARS